MDYDAWLQKQVDEHFEGEDDYDENGELTEENTDDN